MASTRCPCGLRRAADRVQRLPVLPDAPGFETRLWTMRADGSDARRLPMTQPGFDVEPRGPRTGVDRVHAAATAGGRWGGVGRHGRSRRGRSPSAADVLGPGGRAPDLVKPTAVGSHTARPRARSWLCVPTVAAGARSGPPATASAATSRGTPRTASGSCSCARTRVAERTPGGLQRGHLHDEPGRHWRREPHEHPRRAQELAELGAAVLSYGRNEAHIANDGRTGADPAITITGDPRIAQPTGRHMRRSRLRRDGQTAGDSYCQFARAQTGPTGG